MNLEEIKKRMQTDALPCGHRGCIAHVSHTCEICGRQNVNGVMIDPEKKWLIAEIERLGRGLENIAKIPVDYVSIMAQEILQGGKTC